MRHSLSLALLLPALALLPAACELGDDPGRDSSDLTGCAEGSTFRVGSGIYDVTGPAAGLGMMGYAMLGQKTAGIHTRLWSRAHVIESPCSDTRVVFVSVDLQSVSQAVKQAVIRRLQEIFGDVYHDGNVLLSATHTHSGPGGYALYALYDLTIKGFNQQNFDAIVQGITESIVAADMSLAKASIRSARVTADVPIGVNRSADAYQRNPEDERERYATDTNPEMVLLRFDRPDGTSPGLINWYALHGTSMSNHNRLISSDNKGRASYIFEKWKRQDPKLPGTFVASFAQADEGDVSPTGPLGSNADGHADFSNTQQAGVRQFNLAKRAYDTAKQVTGDVGFVHTYVKFDAVTVAPEFGGGQPHTTCPAALGLSMIAGTEDGKGFGAEGMSCSEINSSIPLELACTLTQNSCQGEKPVLLTTGTKKPVPWTPEVLPLQILRVANTAIVGVPFELTTMAGRRVREQVMKDVAGSGIDQVVIAGLSNAYAGYVATREEYAQQDYEGASTHFGPYELGAILQEVHKLAVALRNGDDVDPGPAPRVIDPASAIHVDPRPNEDKVPSGKAFGQIEIDALASYNRGEVVNVSFFSAHPAQNLRTMDSYVYVEMKTGAGWTVVQNDNDPETIVRFPHRSCRLLATCYLAAIEWTIRADATPGTYRIRHAGEAVKAGHTAAYEGISREFTVK